MNLLICKLRSGKIWEVGLRPYKFVDMFLSFSIGFISLMTTFVEEEISKKRKRWKQLIYQAVQLIPHLESGKPPAIWEMNRLGLPLGVDPIHFLVREAHIRI